MNFRNFKLPGFVTYGKGSFQKVDEILSHKRVNNLPVIFFVDDFFKNNANFLGTIPLRGNDQVIFIDVTHEPKTTYVDELKDSLTAQFGEVSGIVGIGGGSVLDITKAVSLMMKNPGSSADYQGWDLVKYAGVYKMGIPSISGTGAEVSRTCVLTGPTRKLGMNSDFTPFDQILLDPLLLKTVPEQQRFYTGMDCYIHCIESLNGTYLNAFSRMYGEKALDLCEEIFLHKDEWDDDSDEKLMMASYAGGMSIAYSQVGVAHAVSYGLSYLLGTKHGIGNCIVFDKLAHYYPDGVLKFKEMISKNKIEIPKNLTQSLTEDQFNKMISISLGMEPLWENAIGKNWKSTIDHKTLRELYGQF
ncbi:iron-containing alcohol dehydrogenase family protein [Flavihumibacter profundi]|uniref:iron-containing alcohol dehydrogenase family protein n=1 Tax=Flavihumibacter profundi TaxID=2716883 RepID=UPI001CC50490|nr:iron-containing alcohol dehydrogenase family protein [Flavihumibacter profundi]MBZ5857220.1 iron-containing alcohol dehydrogenase [Flavihumibacter profundi]